MYLGEKMSVHFHFSSLAGTSTVICIRRFTTAHFQQDQWWLAWSHHTCISVSMWPPQMDPDPVSSRCRIRDFLRWLLGTDCCTRTWRHPKSLQHHPTSGTILKDGWKQVWKGWLAVGVRKLHSLWWVIRDAGPNWNRNPSISTRRHRKIKLYKKYQKLKKKLDSGSNRHIWIPRIKGAKLNRITGGSSRGEKQINLYTQTHSLPVIFVLPQTVVKRYSLWKRSS